MATGKSAVGPLVSARLGMPFVDIDAEIEREAGSSIRELWAREGEAAFRAREAALARRTLTDGVRRVVALGGGAVTDATTRRTAIDHAIVVTLSASPETILRRAGELASRPNLMAGGDPGARVRELLAQRAEAYAECHVRVGTDGATADAVADAVVAAVHRDPLLVPLGTRSYAIDVCAGDPSQLAAAIERCSPSTLIVVTDENVLAARGASIDAALRSISVPIHRVTLRPGEQNKTLESVATIWDAALAGRTDREGVVVAIGGGVVGDLAGFAASALLRGVRFVQAPTTLLAMVDSSVGGKTGFDHAAGKNLIGAFHQPSAVVVDLAHLATLDARQRAAGLAEVVKIALATDEGLLWRLEDGARALASGDIGAPLPLVRRAIDAKIRVVRDDEREWGQRALLNLGHTIGHALEAHGGYARWLHGEAVALGTVAELRATVRLGWTDPALLGRAIAILEALHLPTRVDASDVAAAWPYVASDKKRGGDAVRFPVVTAPGQGHVRRVPLADLFGAVTSA
jgi:shikimate kinase/3-dehydroquinate synthase